MFKYLSGAGFAAGSMICGPEVIRGRCRSFSTSGRLRVGSFVQALRLCCWEYDLRAGGDPVLNTFNLLLFSSHCQLFLKSAQFNY